MEIRELREIRELPASRAKKWMRLLGGVMSDTTAALRDASVGHLAKQRPRVAGSGRHHHSAQVRAGRQAGRDRQAN